MRIFTSLFFCLSVFVAVLAQNPDTEAIARQFLQSQKLVWELSDQDIQDLRLDYTSYSGASEVKHLYFVQRYQGVDVYNKIYNVSIKDSEVIHAAHRLERGLAEKIGSNVKTLTPAEALSRALVSEGAVVNRSALETVSAESGKTVFDRIPATDSKMPVRLQYMPDGQGLYNLAWVTEFQLVGGHDLWSVVVDASSGKILGKRSLTTHCRFEDNYLKQAWECEEHAVDKMPMPSAAGDGSQYTVIKFPTESPIHGNHEIADDPADPDASPFGWHDTDGIDGAEFTHTQGNNVQAFVDRENDNVPDTVVAEGGPQLMFNFPFDPDIEPVGYQRAAVSNMFYAVNFMHDFTYHYGFDEISGNFQFLNYQGAGNGDDEVIARNQVGAGNAEPPLNNASFGTPGDGGNGRLQMYVWEGGSSKLLTVLEPEEVAGKYLTGVTSGWAGAITGEPITANVAVVDDGTGQSTLGCNSIQNVAEVAGKIALFDRGSCEFGRKALNAQEASALGVIICNYEEGVGGMAAGQVGDQVTIPVVMISYGDCQAIRAHITNGLLISLVNSAENEEGPARRDGAFDNGVIAHEFGHGISNRLTGGPNQSGCLQNYDTDNDGNSDQGEQMGEGWSDFFSLVTTVRPGDTRFTPRGVGNYADDKPADGNGIRRYAYNTDMTQNPLTFDDIAFESLPHGVGTVWTSMLWDLYWDLVDEYGFDEDLIHGMGGNNLCIQLVMDGMKMQPCQPGFVDARDALLAADMALTGGQNQLIIWKAFARRGLGWSAVQGTEMLRNDNIEAFDLPPFLIKELKIEKQMTSDVDPGDPFSVNILVINDTEEEATNVAVTDLVPINATYIQGTLNLPHDFSGNQITVDVGSIASGDTVEISYNLLSDNLTISERLFFDDFEEGEFNWANFIDVGTTLWEYQDIFFNSSSHAMFFVNQAVETDGSLINIDPIELNVENPVLRFYHTVETEPFYDAGLLMISSDGGVTYYPVESDKFIRGNYTGNVAYSLFAIPNQKGFHGKSNGWFASYVDLSDYIGETVHLRFRFASDAALSELGWGIDDVEVLNGKFYNSEACVTSDQSGMICAEASARGTFINYGEIVSVNNPEAESFDLKVYPNPNEGVFRIEVQSEQAQDFQFTLMSLEGKSLWTTEARVQGVQTLPVNVSGLAEGFYLLEVEGEIDRTVRKLFIR